MLDTSIEVSKSQGQIMPAYLIITRVCTRNPAELERYAKRAPDFLKGFTLKFLARFGECEVKEGPGVESAAILEFPSMEDARAWYESPMYQEASQHRFKGGDYSAIIVDGVRTP